MKHRLQVLAIATLALLTLATSSRGDIGMLDPAAKPGTKLGPGYQIAMSVSVAGVDERELCGQFPLDKEGRLEFTLGLKPMEKLPLKGLTAEEARQRILKSIKEYFAIPPEVKVGIAQIPRFQVFINGAVFRSGIITLPDGARLSDLLVETGYFPSADLRAVLIRRQDGRGSSSIVRADFARVLAASSASDDRFNDPPLENGDSILVSLATAPPVPQTVMVLGEVTKPGAIPYKKGMVIKDALDSAILSPAADRDQLILRRPKDNSYTNINLTRALKGEPTDNLKLNPDDVLFVMRKDSGLRYAVMGAVPSPQTFEFKKPVTLSQAIMDAGGLKPNADRGRVVISRNALSDPTKSQPITIDFGKISRGEMPDPPLQAGDVVQIPEHRKQNNGLLDIGLMLIRFLLF